MTVSVRWRELQVLPTQAPRAVFLAFALVSTAFFTARFWTVIAAGELFHRLGFDWSLFYAQAIALRAGEGPNMYDPSEIAEYVQPLLRYSASTANSVSQMPVPYPPWFAAAIVPLTFLEPPTAFAVWLGVSLLAALFLAYRVSQFLPRLTLVGALAAILAVVPISWGLFLGQPALLLAIPVGEMMISFKAGRDFRAGLWLAVLLLKPQYVVLFGLLILWKRRWTAVGGAILSGLALVVVGVLAAGLPTLLSFPAALGAIGTDMQDPLAGPTGMMNWRAIILALRPGIDDDRGHILFAGMALLTAAACLLPWRGPWNPQSSDFAPRFSALTLGTLISSYHSHLHGAALLIVPLAAAWAAPTFRFATRLAIWVSIYILTFIVIWVTGVLQRLAVSPDANVPLWTVWPDQLPAPLFVLAFGLMCLDLARRPKHEQPDQGRQSVRQQPWHRVTNDVLVNGVKQRQVQHRVGDG